MHSVPHTPAHGNWIWLASGILSVTVLTGAALHYTHSPRPAAPTASTAAGAARPGLATGTAGAGLAGPGAGLARTSAAGLPATLGSGPLSWADLARRGWQPTDRAPGPRVITSGVAVFYRAAGTAGSCSLSPFSATGWYVTLSPRYANSAACGSYLGIRGPLGWVRAEVVGLCRRCTANVISVSRPAFSRIAGRTRGFARVTFWPATSPPLGHPLVVRASSTASGHLAVQVLHTGNPLVSVAIRPAAQASASWLLLRRNGHDFWVARGPIGRGPFTVRVTDNHGHRVTLTAVVLAAGTVTRTHRWMYRAGPRAP